MWKKMEMNTCDVNHLNANALLPPRKRLLAGRMIQNSDVNSPALSASPNAMSEYDTRLNNLLRYHLSNPNFSNEEIVEASRCAAIRAVKVAKAARANAEEKAGKAAKAVAAAKTALDLVTTLSEESANKDKRQKKNKMKKHVPVQALYNKKKRHANCRTDEEMARKLHRAINSSPRILQNSPGADSNSHKNKKLKSSASSGRTAIHDEFPNGVTNQPLTNNNGVRKVETGGPLKGTDMIMVDLNTSEHERDKELSLNRLVSENGEVGGSSSDKITESPDGLGRKRVKIKQKKLLLSICSFRDQTSPKEEPKPRRGMTDSQEEANTRPFFSSETSRDSSMPVEKTSMWKCQAFQVPSCVAQNKVMQS